MENFVGRVAGKILGGRKVALLGAVGDDAEGAQYRHDDGVGEDDDGAGGENDDGGGGEDDIILVCTVGLFLPQRR